MYLFLSTEVLKDVSRTTQLILHEAKGKSQLDRKTSFQIRVSQSISREF